jgi:hypothetical protein
LTAKDRYRSLCREEVSIAIFSRDWWLDAVCGDERWDVLIVEERGRIVGAMPIYLPHPKVISMPPYTQTMGPWLRPEPGDAKYSTVIGHRQEVCKELVLRLTKYTAFLQNFDYKVTDWLPFYWGGYMQTTRYTYLIDNTAGDITENMTVHIRRQIKKAREKHGIRVRRGVGRDDFMRVNALTFARQGRKAGHTDVLRRLIDVALSRGQGDIWGGYDSEGRLHAAVFIVWQESSAYYIAGGADPTLRHSGSHALVIREAMGDVAGYAPVFDFEGSMLPGVERFFRGFGAVQTPYFAVSKGKVSLLKRIIIKISRGPLLKRDYDGDK